MICLAMFCDEGDCVSWVSTDGRQNCDIIIAAEEGGWFVGDINICASCRPNRAVTTSNL